MLFAIQKGKCYLPSKKVRYLHSKGKLFAIQKRTFYLSFKRKVYPLIFKSFFNLLIIIKKEMLFVKDIGYFI